MPEKKPVAGLFPTQEQTSNQDARPPLSTIEAAVGYSFHDKHLLQEALTHSTYAYEHRKEQLSDNERLEFLGDAVLELIISDILFGHAGDFKEGQMTKTRALLVQETTLSAVALRLNLGAMLRLGKGEEATGGRDKPSNLSNALEALIGALFLDAGYKESRRIIEHLFQEHLALALAGELVYDYKSRLIEFIQADRNFGALEYVILKETGPVHERIFTAGVRIGGELIATGTGSSKKDAEQDASATAFRFLQQQNS